MKSINILIMALLSFISMYLLMYMMVDRYDNIFPNLNQFYMATIMTAPMLLIEIFLMKSMYKNKTALKIILISSIVLLFLFSFFIRRQTAISDKEFLKSMIPHHAGAILMCKNIRIQDPEIKDFCQSIISSQQSEIDWMKRKLSELNKN